MLQNIDEENKIIRDRELVYDESGIPDVDRRIYVPMNGRDVSVKRLDRINPSREDAGFERPQRR